MFDQLKNLGNMMQQAQQMQSRMAEAKEKITELRVEGIAGGEMVPGRSDRRHADYRNSH